MKIRAAQKIIRTGNTARVTLPRPLLIELGMVPGDVVIIEAEGGVLTRFARFDPDAMTVGKSLGVLSEMPAELKR